MKKVKSISILLCLLHFSCFLQPPTNFEYIKINVENTTAYQITYYANNDLKKILNSGENFSYDEHKNTTINFFAIGNIYTWNDIQTLNFDYNWKIENPITANISINNNTTNDLIIYINYFDRMILNASNNQSYSSILGNCNLYAMSLDSNEFWEQSINLTVGGYTWDINSIDAKTIPTNTLRIPIGIWSMYDKYTTDPKEKTILHHLNSNDIIDIDVFVNDDALSSLTEMLDGISFDSANVKISINAYWDKTYYNSLVINRGWILIKYIK